MVINPGSRRARAVPARRGWWSGRLATARAVVVLAALPTAGDGWGGEAESPTGTWCYSTAAVPGGYRGPRPILLAWNDPTTVASDIEHALDRAVFPARGPEPAPAPPAGETAETPRVASTASRNLPPELGPHLAHPGPAAPSAGAAVGADDPIARAKQAIAACQTRFTKVQDYSCTFHKRERIEGRLSAPHIMAMKARTNPTSIYFKFARPNRGREAIYVAGRHGGRVIAHDVGIGKLVAGTMRLDPRGAMAMEDNRHPVTEAGIGSLIDSVARHWATELTPEESRIAFHPQVRVGNHPCTMIESVHPRKRPDFLFYMVKLYIDQEHGLPIRFEAYDWPKHPGAAPELVEEYTYLNLRVNVGLRDHDFDPANAQYSFGRF